MSASELNLLCSHTSLSLWKTPLTFFIRKKSESRLNFSQFVWYMKSSPGCIKMCMVQDRDPVSLFHMWQFSFVNIIYCRDCSLSTVCFWLLGEKLIEHICMCLFLGSVFCSVLIYVSVSVSAPYSFHYYKFVM